MYYCCKLLICSAKCDLSICVFTASLHGLWHMPGCMHWGEEKQYSQLAWIAWISPGLKPDHWKQNHWEGNHVALYSASFSSWSASEPPTNITRKEGGYQARCAECCPCAHTRAYLATQWEHICKLCTAWPVQAIKGHQGHSRCSAWSFTRQAQGHGHAGCIRQPWGKGGKCMSTPDVYTRCLAIFQLFKCCVLRSEFGLHSLMFRQLCKPLRADTLKE